MPDTRLLERVKPRLVRAWFDTVLNPIIGGLEAEADLLSRDDYTWRAYGRLVAAFVPIRSYIGEAASANLDQFLSVYPEFQPLLDDHDEMVKTLSEKVLEYAAALAAYDPLRKTAIRLFEETKPAFSDEEEAVKVIAEYVVNGMGRLPNYYLTAQFWNLHGEHVLTLRDDPEIFPFRESAHMAAGNLKECAERFASALKTIRAELSFNMDVPPVE